MNDDHARPIPQGTRPEPPADDDVYVVDTRRTPGAEATARRPPRSGSGAPAAADRHPPERSSTAAPGSATGRLRRSAGRSAPAAPPPPRPRGTGAPPREPRPGRARRVLTVVVVALLAWAAFIVVTPVHAWSQVTREDTTPTGRPPRGRRRAHLPARRAATAAPG